MKMDEKTITETKPADPVQAQTGSQPAGRLPDVQGKAGLKDGKRGLPLLRTEKLMLNMGPQHPSTHGVLKVLLDL